MKKLFSLLLVILAVLSTVNAQDSCDLEISLLTCAPGEELYSTFGHSALRVRNVATAQDVVYNYGTFEFSPEFYTQFIQGKLLYYLDTQSFSDFVAGYEWEKRSIVEQPLLLSCAEKQKLLLALVENSLDSNKYYRYDFLFDNCSTRLRDILSKGTDQPVVYGDVLGKEEPTFRDLIHTYLDRGGQYWSKLGIDMLLGMKLDRKASSHQSMFLPDYLMKGYAVGTTGGKNIAAPPQTLLAIESPLNKGSWFRPSVVFSLILAIMILLSFSRSRTARITLSILDKFIFFFTGLAGIIMLFMWFGTDHEVCSDNFNLVWALPTHIIAAWLIGKNKGWLLSYFSVVFILLALFLLLLPFLPQEINLSLIPLLFILTWRSFHFSNFRDYVFRKYRTAQG